ncbi:MAG: non-canonical purine NTP pyrophosphatase [Gemmatimonadetes bacterium]|nr:non-canonical purine NTP pyrophosphatase [Gemmatimonadota bacterium]
MTLLLATRSRHKAREVERILAEVGDAGFRLVTLDDVSIPWSDTEESLEPFETFEENAASKAGYFALRSGLPTVADDSGLEVLALNGRPGVRTKRFAPPGRYPGLTRDEANNRHLLDSLGGVPSPDRGARYVCVACFIDPANGNTASFRGEAGGRILVEPRGSGGFGYDPIFLDVRTGRSYAQLSPGEKDEQSHRGQAFRALAAFLRT